MRENHNNLSTSPALDFLRGEGQNGEGYYLDQILMWSNETWENPFSEEWIFPRHD